MGRNRIPIMEEVICRGNGEEEVVTLTHIARLGLGLAHNFEWCFCSGLAQVWAVYFTTSITLHC